MVLLLVAEPASPVEAKPKKKPFFVRRYEKDIVRLGKKLAKDVAKLEKLREKERAGKITKAKFENKKLDLERHERRLSARIRTLQGAIRKEMHKGDEDEE